MADSNFASPSVPDCFQEADVAIDCFTPEHLDLQFHDESAYMLDQFQFTDVPMTAPPPSYNPSDVSSDGSGCVEVPSSEAGDEGGSLGCPTPRASVGAREGLQFACSGESVSGGEPEQPDDTVTTSGKQQFVLVRLDEHGRYMRTANDDDMRLLVKLLNASDGSCKSSAEELMSTISDAEPTTSVPAAPVVHTHTTGQRKPGGPCCHCGATESPQWRRGPTNKPVLCNACGTRFRRTNQLGVAIPSYLKDKSRGTACVSKKRPAKELKDAADRPAPAKAACPRSGPAVRPPSARRAELAA